MSSFYPFPILNRPTNLKIGKIFANFPHFIPLYRSAQCYKIVWVAFAYKFWMVRICLHKSGGINVPLSPLPLNTPLIKTPYKAQKILVITNSTNQLSWFRLAKLRGRWVYRTILCSFPSTEVVPILKQKPEKTGAQLSRTFNSKYTVFT